MVLGAVLLATSTYLAVPSSASADGGRMVSYAACKGRGGLHVQVNAVYSVTTTTNRVNVFDFSHIDLDPFRNRAATELSWHAWYTRHPLGNGNGTVARGTVDTRFQRHMINERFRADARINVTIVDKDGNFCSVRFGPTPWWEK